MKTKMNMTIDVGSLKSRLDAKCVTCGDVKTKYREAFRDGVRDAKAVLDKYRTVEQAMEELKRLLQKSPYLSGEKTESYRKAVRSAMSMLHNMKENGGK